MAERTISEIRIGLTELLSYLRTHEAWHRTYASRKDNEAYPDLVAGSIREAEKWGCWADAVEKVLKEVI